MSKTKPPHSFDAFLAEQLQDPEIKAEYDSLAPEFSSEEVVWEIEVDADLYEQAKAVFAEYGLTIEEATVQFIKATIACGRLPFPYTEEDIKAAKALMHKGFE